jgi:hypothetical protein
MSTAKKFVRRATPTGATTKAVNAGTAAPAKRPGRSLRAFRLGEGAPSPAELSRELDEYVQVLLGRETPPIDNGVMTLMEYANAVYSRAQEINMKLQHLERDGHVTKGSSLYKFRTGELRTFIELSHRAAELGSRRVTYAQMEWEAKHG